MRSSVNRPTCVSERPRRYFSRHSALVGTWLLLTASLLLSIATAATAGTITNDRPLLFSFDGSDSSIGAFNRAGAVAIDQSNADVYVLNSRGGEQGPGPFDPERAVCKFDAQGKSQVFSATGKSCLDGSATPSGAFGIEGHFPGDVAIDNSGGSGGPGEGEQGRIYVSEVQGPIHAFSPAGVYLWTLPKTSAQPDDIDVDGEGHLWVANGEGEGAAKEKVREFANSGSPPAKIGEFTATHSAGSRACHLAVDSSGQDVYVGFCGISSGDSGGIDKYVAGTYDSTLAPPGHGLLALAIDRSKASGHIFGLFASGVIDNIPEPPNGFKEYEPCAEAGCAGSEVTGSSFGEQVISGFGGSPNDIDYNSAKDWVYVADEVSGLSRFSRVKVFGPVASGPVPDVTTGKTDEITRTEATAHGTINPQGLPSSYRFEFKRCSTKECKFSADLDWGGGIPAQGGCEPPLSLPADSNPHSVSCRLEGLSRNSFYQVRLVGINSETHLSEYSAPDLFKTLPPPPSTVEGCSISAITTSSAHVGGCMIGTEEDETTWKVLRSVQVGATQAQCKALEESKFTKVSEGTIPSGETAPIGIEANLSELLSAQTTCVRVTATNSGGPGREDLVFKTFPKPPVEAETAFAAPRTDTTARINGRLNPEGETTFSYRFELSSDGVNWTLLPAHEESAGAWEPIVVGDDLTGLQPDTTYHYRLASAENEAGSVAGAGDERTFTTRTTAEMAIPPNALGEAGKRGIELVNQPDDGNQNVQMGGTSNGVGRALISADGAKALWNIFAGAPGAANAAESVFVAKRNETGWTSSPIAPPPEQQFGSGDISPTLLAASPDLSQFVMQYFGEPESALARFDSNRVQHLLGIFPSEGGLNNKAIDVTDDGAHVLIQNEESGQIEDDGSGSPEVVSLMPDGTPSECGMEEEGSSFVGTTNDGAGAGRYWRPGYHRIATTDASRVYFQVKPNDKCGAGVPLALYVRNREADSTTLIDPGSGSSAPHFIRTTPDGRVAYFVTKSACAKYDQSNSSCKVVETKDTNGDPDVYRWDEAKNRSTCITCEVSTDVDLSEANGGVAVSDDFSHVYFESKEVLAPGAVVGTGVGGANIYSMSGGAIRFVANIGKSNFSDRGVPGAELSDHGDVIVFRAIVQLGLTADRVAPECSTPEHQPIDCIKRYLYDERDGSLECLDCVHGGLSSHADFLDTARISTDGSTVAFNTPEALVPLDVNRDNDVYEWRNGAVRLITDGVSDFPDQAFATPKVTAVDSDGTDIFFTAAAGNLTGFEHSGGLANAYDARIGGGFTPPLPPAHCAEDSCQGPLQAAPAQSGVSSLDYAGNGNPRKEAAKPRCRKSKVRRKGRCVARHPHKRQKRTTHAKQGRSK